MARRPLRLPRPKRPTAGTQLRVGVGKATRSPPAYLVRRSRAPCGTWVTSPQTKCRHSTLGQEHPKPEAGAWLGSQVGPPCTPGRGEAQGPAERVAGGGCAVATDGALGPAPPSRGGVGHELPGRGWHTADTRRSPTRGPRGLWTRASIARDREPTAHRVRERGDAARARDELRLPSAQEARPPAAAHAHASSACTGRRPGGSGADAAGPWASSSTLGANRDQGPKANGEGICQPKVAATRAPGVRRASRAPHGAGEHWGRGGSSAPLPLSSQDGQDLCEGLSSQWGAAVGGLTGLLQRSRPAAQNFPVQEAACQRGQHLHAREMPHGVW